MKITIASRYWSQNCPVFYVESVKGKTSDWGYTTDYHKAAALTPYWQRRFAADCRCVGVEARFTELDR